MTTSAPHPATRLLTILLAVLVTSATLAVGPAEAAARTRTTPELKAEDVVLALHNEARANPKAFGYDVAPVAALTGWTDIRDVARSWADRQAADKRMFHNPNFSTQLCCWTTVGENVAFITLSTLDDASVESASRRIFQAWMDSTGHRDNILASTYDQMGLGISITQISGGYAMYLTANFRKVSGTAPGSSYGPTPAPPALDTPACPEGEFARAVFSDTLTGTHAGTLDCMAWWGVITSADASGGVIGQKDLASRAFMAAVIDRLAAEGGKALPPATRDHFDDDDGHRYEAAINRVVEAGIAKGGANGNFAPNASLSRAQMATFLSALYRDWLRLPTPSTVTDRFRDDAGSVHERNIDLVAATGIANGTGPDTFSPSANLTRGQLASFAANLANALVAQGIPAGGVL